MLFSQILFSKNTNISSQTVNEIEYLKMRFNVRLKKQEAMDILTHEYHTINFEKVIVSPKDSNLPLTKEESNAIVTLILDNENNWSENYARILKLCDFPDFRVITYKSFIRLLKIEKNEEKLELLADQLYEEFPTINLSVVIKYELLIRKSNIKEAENLLVQSKKLTQDPYVEMLYLIHRMRYEHFYDEEKIKKCIELRNQIEYNPRYTKKNLEARFDYLYQYYFAFISESLKKDNKVLASKLLINFYNDFRIKNRHIFDSYYNSIKSDYPDFYKDFTSKNRIE